LKERTKGTLLSFLIFAWVPRQARIDIPGHLYHVIARSIERGKIFVDGDDYTDFLSRLDMFPLLRDHLFQLPFLI